MTTTTRVCTLCGKRAVLAEFTWNAKTPVCKECSRRRNAEYTRRRRADNPDLVRAANLWKSYRITVEQYEVLRERQGRRCAICGIHEDDIDRERIGGRRRADGTKDNRFPLSVDHCHTRDAVRGLLCPPCNIGVGHFADDPARMRAAAAYVEQTPVIEIDRTAHRKVQTNRVGYARVGWDENGRPYYLRSPVMSSGAGRARKYIDD